MNLKEFKTLLSETTDTKWFNSVDIAMSFPVSSEEFNFKGMADLHRFLYEQINGWGKLENSLPSELIDSLKYFISIESKIIDFINRYKTEEGGTLTANFRSILNSLKDNPNIFTYDSPESDFLINIFNNERDYYLGAYTYLIGDLNANISQKKNFNGYLLAYEFKFKSKSEITNRRKSERTSLNKLKSDFKNNLGELDSQLVDHLSESTKKYKNFGSNLEKFQADKEKDYTDWAAGSRLDFKTFHAASKEKINELEDTYVEKLKLAAPAEYWEKRAKSLRKQGRWAMAILIVLVGIVVWSLGELLWKVPEQIYSSFFDGDKSAAIRWSVIYVTFISFMAFGIRAITKVMFSSFHLARDSEERYTLTYFYLSLLKDSSVDKEERQLIMQSLFSRAETGLLKDDSTPAMPNDMVGKFFGSGK